MTAAKSRRRPSASRKSREVLAMEAESRRLDSQVQHMRNAQGELAAAMVRVTQRMDEAEKRVNDTLSQVRDIVTRLTTLGDPRE
jgi:seryl-tRNA synthetase